MTAGFIFELFGNARDERGKDCASKRGRQLVTTAVFVHCASFLGKVHIYHMVYETDT